MQALVIKDTSLQICSIVKVIAFFFYRSSITTVGCVRNTKMFNVQVVNKKKGNAKAFQQWQVLVVVESCGAHFPGLVALTA